MFSGDIAKDTSWKAKEQSEEARYAHEKEVSQLAAIRERIREQEQSSVGIDTAKTSDGTQATTTTTTEGSGDKKQLYFERDFESGFGGQEDLEDRYATTSGEH